MLVVAAISGGVLLFRREPPASVLTVWVFADSHARLYRPLEPQFESKSGQSLEIELITTRALNVRLMSLFMSGQRDKSLPDAVEIELTSIGRYFRPPLSQIGFLPLNEYLQNSGFREIESIHAPGRKGWNARIIADGRIYTHDGMKWVLNPARTIPDAWIDRIVKSRFAPWSRDGVIFGVPHDVHPVTITYREDLFREAGIDLSAAKTWREFHLQGLAFQRYWSQRGYRQRHALELSRASAEHLSIMLLQRGINLVDDRNHIHIAERKVAETLAFYVQLVEGPQQIAGEASSGTGPWVADIEAGNLCASLTPDWRVNYLRVYGKELRGKLRMMPLPRFDPTDAPTSTWGGTMIGIPKDSPSPHESWKLIEFLYFSEEALDRRRREGDILPPLMEYWDHPDYHLPDPLFGGQMVKELYVELAPQIPRQYATPVSSIANSVLTVVLNRAVAHFREHGEVGLLPAIEKWLEVAEVDLQARIEQSSFDGQDR